MTRLGFRNRPAHTGCHPWAFPWHAGSHWGSGGAMTRDWDDADDREESRDARRRRRRRRHRSGPQLAPDERAHRDAARRAKARGGFSAHLIAYAGVNMLLPMGPGRRAEPFLLIAWGI